MGSHQWSRGMSVALTLVLLSASLVTLRAGGFILFDDTTGYGTNTSGVGLLVALLLASGALYTALGDAIARRVLGGALAVLDATIVAIGASDDGFRFFWTTYEGELLQFEVVLGLVALVLLTPSFLRSTRSPHMAAASAPRTLTGRGLTAWARASLYLCALAVAMFIAFGIGIAHFEATQCSGPEFGGECDLAALEGLLWAAGALVLGVIAILVMEVRGARSRRADRGHHQHASL